MQPSFAFAFDDRPSNLFWIEALLMLIHRRDTIDAWVLRWVTELLADEGWGAVGQA